MHLPKISSSAVKWHLNLAFIVACKGTSYPVITNLVNLGRDMGLPEISNTNIDGQVAS